MTVIVSKARRKQWWRNFRDPMAVSLRIRGRRHEGTAQLVAPNDPRYRDAFEATFSRVALLPRQFGIEDHRKGEKLTPDQLERVREQGQLVLIELASSGPWSSGEPGLQSR